MVIWTLDFFPRGLGPDVGGFLAPERHLTRVGLLAPLLTLESRRTASAGRTRNLEQGPWDFLTRFTPEICHPVAFGDRSHPLRVPVFENVSGGASLRPCCRCHNTMEHTPTRRRKATVLSRQPRGTLPHTTRCVLYCLARRPTQVVPARQPCCSWRRSCAIAAELQNWCCFFPAAAALVALLAYCCCSGVAVALATSLLS